MDTSLGDSFHTTASMDFTLQKHQSLIDTPVKPVPAFPHRYCHHLRKPPPKSAAPNQNTGVKRMSMEEISVALAQNIDNSEQRLRIMSFKRQRLEVRLDLLQRKTVTLRVRDEAINRRHVELYHQRIRLDANSCGISMHDSSRDEVPDTKRLLQSTEHATTTTRSQRQLGKFRCNSVVGRASHRSIYQSSLGVTEVPCSFQMAQSTEAAHINFRSIDEPSFTNKPVRKVKKTPSLRLKRFLQKKLKLSL